MHPATYETNLSLANVSTPNNLEPSSMPVFPVAITKLESLSDLIQQQKHNAKEETVLNSYGITICPTCSNKIPTSNFNKHLDSCPEVIMELKVKCDISDNLSFFVRRKLIDQKDIFAGNWHTNKIIKQTNLKSGDELISFDIYERNHHEMTPSLDYQQVSIKLDNQYKLKIIKMGNKNMITNIDKKKHINNLKNIPERLTNEIISDPEINSWDLKLYRTISTYTRSYTIRLCAYFSSISWFPVCQHELSSLHSVELLDGMYNYNKENVSRSYIDLIEFFTHDGLSREYIKKYGPDVNWLVEVFEKNK